MLTCMLLVSVFAINAAAVVDTTYTVIEGARDEAVYLTQDFSDMEANTAFAPGNTYGTQAVVDGDLSFTGMNDTGKLNGAVEADVNIPSGEYEVTLDVRRNHSMTKHLQLYVIFQRAQNAESADANLKQHGILFPVQILEEDVWYNIKVVVDETTYKSDAKLESLAKVYYKKAADANWTAASHVGSSSPGLDRHGVANFRSFNATGYTAGIQ